VLLQVLDGYTAASRAERADVERIRHLVAAGDPWSRSLPLHVTGSAVIVHPPSQRVLLRWHERMQAWLQVGGHADPGENDPLSIALREGFEETGLDDLAPWPAGAPPQPMHIAVVPVPAGRGEPAHEHADVRYVLATFRPDAIRPESDSAQLAWLSVPEAMQRVAEDNLHVCLERVARLF
jgi:8-oxo-dGTP pyrophosphatase MutT (NUDIX family)